MAFAQIELNTKMNINSDEVRLAIVNPQYAHTDDALFAKEGTEFPWKELNWLSLYGSEEGMESLKSHVAGLAMDKKVKYTRFFRKIGIPDSAWLLKIDHGMVALATIWSRLQLKQWLVLPKTSPYADSLLTTYAQHGVDGKIHVSAKYRFSDDRTYGGLTFSPMGQRKIRKALDILGGTAKRHAVASLGAIPQEKLEKAKHFYTSSTAITAEMIATMAMFILEKAGGEMSCRHYLNCYQLTNLSCEDHYEIDKEAGRLILKRNY